MKRRTHIVFGIILFVVINLVLRFPILYGVFVIFGSIFPDLDLKFMHRKLLHNIWVLILMVVMCTNLGFMDNKIAIVFSIGFIGHLISDSLTPAGIMPFWPISKPRIRWKIKTGSFGEIIFLLLLIVISISVMGVLL